jgi:hypothetical protein
MPSPRDRFEIYPDRQPSSRALDGNDWIEARAGGLETPILARIGRNRDGRPIITGLMIGEFDDGEITADTLRAIRPRALLEQLFEGFDADEPPGLTTPAAEGELPDLLEQVEWGLMQEHVWSPAREQAVDQQQTTPARGPSQDQLREFAAIYRERLADPGRARPMTATAEAMRISRPTANRWAKLCRDRGLLPPK